MSKKTNKDKKANRKMSRKMKILLSVLGCVAVCVVGYAIANASPAADDGQPNSNNSSGLADRVDVVYFHRTQRCPKCIHAEESINYTVETYFADELASGKVTFQVLDVQDEENAAIVKKYRAYTSSLFINTIRDGTDHIEEVWYIWLLLDNHEAFVEAVRSKIEKSLKGEE